MAGNRTIHEVLNEAARHIENLKVCVETLRSMDRAEYPEEACGYAKAAMSAAEKIRSDMSGLVGALSGATLRRDRRFKVATR